MTVAPWGKGRPDYMKAVIASRPVIVDVQQEQTRVLVHKRFTIAAGAVAINAFYTVPAEYKLALGGGFITVKDSCINKLRLVIPNLELVGDFRYDMQGNLSMTALAGQEINGETSITAYIFNNDSIESEFSLLLSGVLTRA